MLSTVQDRRLSERLSEHNRMYRIDVDMITWGRECVSEEQDDILQRCAALAMKVQLVIFGYSAVGTTHLRSSHPKRIKHRKSVSSAEIVGSHRHRG